MVSEPTVDADEVDASATKRFFVEMLTRDIELKDAILDLLDNCVDGVHRTSPKTSGPSPYERFWASITIKKGSFEIEDNCGGITSDVIKKYAFRLGRPTEADSSVKGLVGRYGIGMKRAIFKMGRHAIVQTRTKQDGAIKVEIPPSWFDDDKDWKLRLTREAHGLKEIGTRIFVDTLTTETAHRFARSQSEDLIGFLRAAIGETFAFILAKGFQIFLNGDLVAAPKIYFLINNEKLNDATLQPYRYWAEFQTEKGKLHVSLVAGLTRAVLLDEEEDEEKELARSVSHSGWTVICNDRVVLANDRSLLTGWGEAGVPAFHNQFIGVSGVVEFTSDDPGALPITTTKRGVDSSSEIYLEVKNFMREGISVFTGYTNDWKADRKTERAYEDESERVLVSTLLTRTPNAQARTISGRTAQKRYKPQLPEPPRFDNGMRIIRFSRSVKSIEDVSELLFGERTVPRNEVGEKCFDVQYKRSKK